MVESQKEGPQCASVCLPLFFHRLFDCDFITEFDVKSVLDAGKVMKPIQAGRSPVWLSLFLIMIYILEIWIFFRCLCYMQLKNRSVTGSVDGKKFIMVWSEQAREMKEPIVDPWMIDSSSTSVVQHSSMQCSLMVRISLSVPT